MKCSISEIFGPTIQGEGYKTGEPTFFVRFSGCNLRCAFANSICDTAYTSHHLETPAYTTTGDAVAKLLELHEQYPMVEHIVFTGGEPLLQQEALQRIVESIWTKTAETHAWYFTIETNGTISPSIDLLNIIGLWSISPKLKNSECFEKHNISTSAAELHQSNRVNYKAICTILKHGFNFQLKFVYGGAETEQDILDWFAEFNCKIEESEIDQAWLTEWLDPSFGESKILLMPAGTTVEEINQNSEAAIDVCVKRGWRFCDRTHIRIWGDRRCV